MSRDWKVNSKTVLLAVGSSALNSGVHLLQHTYFFGDSFSGENLFLIPFILLSLLHFMP